MEEFFCEQCEQTFGKGWSDEEMRAEFEQNFPEDQQVETMVVCDDCYQAILARKEA